MGDWHVTATPSRARLTERLSNGQYLNMWFWRQRVKDKEKQITYIWTVGLYIGSKKGAALWRRKKHRTKQTGTAGIEGLRIALSVLRSFADGMGFREELQVLAEDKKRARAYRYLLRYPGFKSLENDKGYMYRHPDFWEWIAEEGERE